jgi:hypothetical protein
MKARMDFEIAARIAFGRGALSAFQMDKPIAHWMELLSSYGMRAGRAAMTPSGTHQERVFSSLSPSGVFTARS